MKQTIKNTVQQNQDSGNGLPQQFIFHEDPGHGWLEVPYSALRELDIEKKITGFSYRSRNGQTVYLEEDLDTVTFINAYLSRTSKALEDFRRMCERRYSEDSFIRRLPKY